MSTRDSLTSLPLKRLFGILSSLDLVDILRCECTCRTLCSVVNSTAFLTDYSKRKLGGLRFYYAPPLSDVDKFVVAELRSLAQGNDVRLQSAPIDPLIAHWFKMRLWTHRPVYAYAKPFDFPDDEPSVDEPEQCTIPLTDRYFWSTFFAAFPELSDVLLANGVDYVHGSERNLYAGRYLGGQFGDFTRSAPPGVREKLQSSRRRMHIEVLVIARLMSSERCGLAIFLFEDASWVAACVVLEEHTRCYCERHKGCDNHELHVSCDAIAWTRSLVAHRASVDELRIAAEPAVRAFVAQPTQRAAELLEEDDYGSHSLTNEDIRRRFRETVGDLLGGGVSFDARAYDECRRATIACFGVFTTRTAKRFARRLEDGKSFEDVLKLRRHCDALVQSCDCGREFVESKTLAVAAERAVRRLVNGLVVGRLKALGRGDPPLVMLAYFDFLGDAVFDIFKLMASGHHCTLYEHERNKDFTIDKVNDIAQAMQNRLCKHAAMPSIWPLSVARLALRLAEFAVQLISFELLAFERSGLRSEGVSYKPTEVSKIAAVGRERYGVDVAESAGQRLSDQCKLLCLTE